MRKLLPILLLAVALTAIVLWHARTRETDGRQADARPVLSGNEAQTTEVPGSDDGGTETEAARQPVGDEDVVLDEDVLEEILLYASRAIRYYSFSEVDKTKQPLVRRCKAGLCVTFPRIAAPTRPAGRDFAAKVILDPKSHKLIGIVGATSEEQPVAEATGRPISDKEAIAIALKEIGDAIPEFDSEKNKPSVLRSDTAVSVTFLGPPSPPRVKGPDFEFIITIDAKSMEVLRVLQGR